MTNNGAEVRLSFPFSGGVPFTNVGGTDLKIHLRRHTVAQVDLEAPWIESMLLQIDETWCDDMIGGVDGFSTLDGLSCNGCDPTVVDPYIGDLIETCFGVHDPSI